MRAKSVKAREGFLQRQAQRGKEGGGNRSAAGAEKCERKEKVYKITKIFIDEGVLV